MSAPSQSRTASLLLAGGLIGCLLTTCAYALLERGRGVGGRNESLVLKLGHCLDTKHPVHLAMERMAERLDELSAGSMRILIAPNGQLGSETECVELLQRGALAMAKTSSAALEGFVPEVAVFGVPYLFQSEDHFWRVVNGPLGKELLAAGQPRGLMGLCWYDAGARSFYTRSTPILKPNDLKGLKFRVQNSRTSMRMVEALGGSPTPIAFGELYTGLQQGLVDGAENNPPSFWASRHFEVCNNYSLDEHTRVPDVLLISDKWWSRLNAEQRAWVQEAADESSVWQREVWGRHTQEALDAVREAGVTIHRPELKNFVERVSEMHSSYDGTPVGALMERVLETP